METRFQQEFGTLNVGIEFSLPVDCLIDGCHCWETTILEVTNQSTGKAGATEQSKNAEGILDDVFPDDSREIQHPANTFVFLTLVF